MQTVDAGLSSLLLSFLDEESLTAPVTRARLASWPLRGRIDYEEWLACLDGLAQETDMPALGLRIGHCIRAEHLGVVGELAECCFNLGEVLLCLQRYHRIIYDGNVQRVSFEGSDVVLTWQDEYGSFHPAVSDISLAMFVRMGYLLVGDAWRVDEVCIGNAMVTDLTPYEKFFACPVTQGRRMPSVRFSMDRLLLPVRDPRLLDRQATEARAEARLRELYPVADVLGEQLQEAMLKAIYEGSCTLAKVAGHLNISVRSLQRRMAERQQTFAGLLDRTRALIAREQVRDRSQPLWRVAMMLGFSEQSAFNRAFKRWYGVSPKTYRLKGLVPSAATQGPFPQPCRNLVAQAVDGFGHQCRMRFVAGAVGDVQRDIGAQLGQMVEGGLRMLQRDHLVVVTVVEADAGRLRCGLRQPGITTGESQYAAGESVHGRDRFQRHDGAL